MPTETWAADAGGTLRDLTEIWAADPSGDLQRLGELWVADSGGTLRLVFAVPPEIDSCSIKAGLGGGIDVTFSTGLRSESAIVELRASSGDSLVDSATVNTSPNGGPYSHNFSAGAGTYYGVVRPFTGDAATGDEGSSCTTGDQTI